MAETPLGRAVAVAALAPITEWLANGREREERKKEQERRLEEELQKIPEQSRYWAKFEDLAGTPT